MKKILFYILFILCLFSLCCKNKKQISAIDIFINNNDINIEDIKPYFDFKRFIYYDYFELEKLRINNNYSYLETINYFYINHNSSLLLNTDLVLVNKQYLLNTNYIPNLINIDDYPVKITKYNIQIQKHVLLNYIQMINDLELYDLYIYSGYRSYERQKEIYNSSNNKNYVASPGSSEHQTGLALDVSTLKHGLIDNFKYSYEYDLIKNNCMNYGFIIRYPENKEHITGYYFEPWHLRFVGRDNAITIMNNNLTLEQYIFKYIEL